jgi:8-oxo-dGTP pyrophosphatase MutT (NUDIX family)
LGSEGVESVEGAEASAGADAAGAAEAAETGSEVLLEEAREEVGRLVRHPVAEIKRLEHVADEGESAATPLIVAIGIATVIAIIFAIVLTVILLVYYDT